MCPCYCRYWRAASETSALGGVVQPKRRCLAAYPVSAARKKRSRKSRIGHPDWVKLCVELNCAPNQNAFCYKWISNYWVEEWICREGKIFVFWFGAQFNSTLNFTQSGWLILFSPDLSFPANRWVKLPNTLFGCRTPPSADVSLRL